MKINDDRDGGGADNRSDKLLPGYQEPDETPFTVFPIWVWVALIVAILVITHGLMR